MPPLTEIESEMEVTVLPVAFTETSFLDKTLSSIPDLEHIPCPEVTELPSFLGQNYQTRDCSRFTRSKMNRSIFNPI